MDTHADPQTLDVWTDVEAERVGTVATVITGVRTVAAVVLAGFAAHEESLTLLVACLVVYWIGDMLDGFVARILGCETRIGAALDILSDRFCAAARSEEHTSELQSHLNLVCSLLLEKKKKTTKTIILKKKKKKKKQ